MNLALKPDDGETFLREVDDELRREQMSHFMKRYGWALVAAVLLVLAGIGGWIWWKARAAAAAEAQGETLIAALDSLEAGNRGAATPKLDALAGSDVPGYRAAALFARANSQTAAGNAPAAIATLRAIAANQEFDEAYRQAALIRQTQLEFDSLPPQQVVQRLRPLARPGQRLAGQRRRDARHRLSEDAPPRPRRAGLRLGGARRERAAVDPYKSRSDGGLSWCQRRRRARRACRGAGRAAPPAATKE